MLNNEETVKVVNDLIEISKDGEASFLEAAEEIEDKHIKYYLMRRSAHIKMSILELQSLVRELGGRPAESTSQAGNLQRKWTNLKTAIDQRDNLAVLNELERCEYVALHAYREASTKDLHPRVAQIILEQLTGVRQNYDVVKEMHEATKAKQYAI
jgi:uncharacterized protein (TIGR02284 family)